MWWRGQHCRERWENVQLRSMWSFSIILHKRSDQITSGVWFCTMKLLTAVFFAAAYWINEINRRERTSEVDLYTGSTQMLVFQWVQSLYLQWIKVTNMLLLKKLWAWCGPVSMAIAPRNRTNVSSPLTVSWNQKLAHRDKQVNTPPKTPKAMLDEWDQLLTLCGW